MCYLFYDAKCCSMLYADRVFDPSFFLSQPHSLVACVFFFLIVCDDVDAKLKNDGGRHAWPAVSIDEFVNFSI